MKRLFHHGGWLLGLWLAALLPAAASAAELSAAEIMQRNFFVTKVSGFSGELTMTLTNERGEQRVRRIAIWSKLQPNGIDSEVLMRFRQPADVRGTGFLQIEHLKGDDDIWIYLPALGRSRRLVSSNKKDSFFGTDFSYGDILLPAVNKYHHRIIGSEVVDGHPCYVIESVPADPKTRDDSGYSRRVSWIDKQNFLERKVVYYDLNNRLLKTQTVSEAKLVEPDKQRWMALKREMVNHQTGHKTTYSFDRFQLEPALPERMFSIRTLERE